MELYFKMIVALCKVYISLEQFQDKSLTWNNEGMKFRGKFDRNQETFGNSVCNCYTLKYIILSEEM